MPKKTKQWDSYTDYLKSPEWKKIKKEYQKFYDPSVCILCQDAINTLCHHHWHYPSNWSNDSVHNLIIVCEECHNEIHSVFNFKEDKFESRDKAIIKYSTHILSITKNQLKDEAEVTIKNYEDLIMDHVLRGNIKLSKLYTKTETEGFSGKISLDGLFLMGTYEWGLENRIEEVIK